MAAEMVAQEGWREHPTCDPDYEDLLDERRRRKRQRARGAVRDAKP
jgi:hypothetical protein